MRKMIFVAACGLLSSACDGERQKPEMLLYEANTRDPSIQPVDGLPFRNAVIIGPESAPVPLRVTWKPGRDPSNCLRIASLRVERYGGDASIVIKNVKHVAVPCGMEWDSNDTTKFETVIISLDYQRKKGLRSHDFRGGVARITGSGDISKL
jgi:hypothetical protein